MITQPFIQTQITENIKAPRHWPLCGEFTGTGEFPAQRASYAENVSIWWRHHEFENSGFSNIHITDLVGNPHLTGGFPTFNSNYVERVSPLSMTYPVIYGLKWYVLYENTQNKAQLCTYLSWFTFWLLYFFNEIVVLRRWLIERWRFSGINICICLAYLLCNICPGQS